MSGGPPPAPAALPPVPDLIPIAALRQAPPAPAAAPPPAAAARRAPAAAVEVMGEQRPRRRARNRPPPPTAAAAAAGPIDSRAGSRGPGAAPQPPPRARKTRSERHRKSDRRREHRKAAAGARSVSKHRRRSREARARTASPEERPANPRVNPIFVWVRQEDTRIVDVKCEDYDKRNRILLTKTAQGWRAIPRTETLVPSLRDAAERGAPPGRPGGRQKRAKSRKAKLRQRSTSAQFPEEADRLEDSEDAGHDEPPDRDDEPAEAAEATPSAAAAAASWISPENVNVESLLPSHTIHVKRPPSPAERSPRPDFPNVNSAVDDDAQTPPPLKCSADKVCDVSPLDNLLAVAELEFKQQIQSGEWSKSPGPEISDDVGDADAANEPCYDHLDADGDRSQFIDNMEQLSDLIESEGQKVRTNNNNVGVTETKSDECDYNENDDENNMAMNDILSRLEQSLESPECAEVNNVENNRDCDNDSAKDKGAHEGSEKSDDKNPGERDNKPIEENKEMYDQPADDLKEDEDEVLAVKEEADKSEANNLVESSTNDDEQEQPTDLSIKNKPPPLLIESSCDIPDGPTDLSIPKVRSSPQRDIRPPSQNSEAIQSPEPSGIPAVPPSPDIVSTSSTNSSKVRSMFLDTLLSSSSQKIALNSEVTITRQKEPLDLGASRKSASPTVTCSEEVNNSTVQDIEPPLKKFKSNDITLKTLLDAEVQKPERDKSPSKEIVSDIPRLLDLLDTESDQDPITQYKQLLTEINIPNPIMVPQQWFGEILKNPRREILRIMREKPCKSLPPDEVLILYKDKMLAAIEDNYYKNIDTAKANSVVSTNKQHVVKTSSADSSKKKHNSDSSSRQSISADVASKNISANDIDAAEAAFNQMLWLPYANHMDALAFANNQDVLKALYNSFPMFPNDLSLMFGGRLPMTPVNFPPLPSLNYENQFSFWTEAMLNNGTKSKPSDNATQLKQSSSNASPSGSKKFSSNTLPMHNNLPKQQTFPSNCSNGGHTSYQNPYLNTFQHKQSLQIPQYQPYQKMQQKSGSFHQKQKDANSNFFSQLSEHEKQLQYLQSLQQNTNAFSHQQRHYQLQHHQQQQMRHQMHQKHPKGGGKGAANQFPASSSAAGHKNAAQQHQEKMEVLRHPAVASTNQPIDLSGSTCGAKHKVKSTGSDSASARKSSKHHEDVPEVGSTTASIEEMQDAHKHLWHPLFGNSKNYSPWALSPSVTVTGE